MTEQMRVTVAVGRILAGFLAEPDMDHYGIELIRGSGYPSGTVYPILTRLQRAGWIEARWENVDPAQAGRPARRYYRLTPDGVTAAHAAVSDLYQHLAPGVFPGVKAKTV